MLVQRDKLNNRFTNFYKISISVVLIPLYDSHRVQVCNLLIQSPQIFVSLLHFTSPTRPLFHLVNFLPYTSINGVFLHLLFLPRNSATTENSPSNKCEDCKIIQEIPDQFKFQSLATTLSNFWCQRTNHMVLECCLHVMYITVVQ